MRRFLILTAMCVPQQAYAHVGHLGDLAGHSHWIALGAVGIATAVRALGAVKDRKKAKTTDTKAEAPSAPEDDRQEAPV